MKTRHWQTFFALAFPGWILLALTGCGAPTGGSSVKPPESGTRSSGFTLSLEGLNVTQVICEFVRGDQTIAFPLVPTGPIIVIDDPTLAGKTWATTIEVQTGPGPGQSYPLAYQYRADLSFDGSTKALSSPVSDPAAWKQFFLTEVDTERGTARILRSRDPRQGLEVVVRLPSGMYFHDIGETSRTNYAIKPAFQADPEEWIFGSSQQTSLPEGRFETGTMTLPDPPLGTYDSNPIWNRYAIDSTVQASFGPTPQADTPESDSFLIDVFFWQIDQGVLTP